MEVLFFSPKNLWVLFLVMQITEEIAPRIDLACKSEEHLMPRQPHSRRFFVEALEQRVLLTAHELVPISDAWDSEAAPEWSKWDAGVVHNGVGGDVLVPETWRESPVTRLGDFDQDGDVDSDDIDVVHATIRSGSFSAEVVDRNGDAIIDQRDANQLIVEILSTKRGDADLNGKVEFADFLTLSANFGHEGGWAQGDFDGSGEIGSADFLLLSANFGFDRLGTGVVTDSSSGPETDASRAANGGNVVLAAHGVEQDIVTPLRVMTYNVQMFPQGLDRFADLFTDPLNGRCCIEHRTEQIAREVLEKDIDIVGFQELFTRGSAGQVDELIEPILRGWFGPDWQDFVPQHVASGPDARPLGLSSGLVLLSRYPIAETNTLAFDTSSWPDTLARKGVLHAQVRRTAHTFVDVYVTHLDAGSDGAVRADQLGEMSSFLERTGTPHFPTIVMGDMNTNARVEGGEDRPAYDAMMAELRTVRPFIDVWETFHDSDDGGTSAQLSTTSGQRLDYVLYADAEPSDFRLEGEPGDLVPTAITVDPMADARSEFLSDHSAVEATFDWHVSPMHATDYDHFEGGLQYEYFSPRTTSSRGVITTYESMPDFFQLDPNHVDVLATGRYLDIDHSSNYYGVRYRGYLNIPETGEYAFHLSSDDGSLLYVNSQLVVDNDGRHADREKVGYVTLEAGYHPVRLEYFQHRRGDELSLAWSGPTFHRNSLLPSDFSVPLRPSTPASVAEPGLNYTYYHRSGPRIDLGLAPVVSTGRMIGNDYLANRDRDRNYGFRFTGHILAPADGLYTFETRSDDGSRLYIGNQYLVNNDGDHGPQTRHGRIYLRKGYHPIRIEYIQNGGGQRLEVNWDGPGLGGLRGIDASVFTLSPAEEVDHGDAPFEYYEGLDNIPTHGILPGFSLGDHVDADPRPLMSREANRDDLSFTPDDEDGVTNPGGGALTISGGLTRGEENTLQVSVNNSGNIPNPYLDAWIDFNQDGDWDADEHVVSQAVAAGENSIVVAVPADAEFGATFGRFRLHSNTLGGLSRFGPYTDATAGEMEDHRVIVRADFGQTLKMGQLRSITIPPRYDAFGSSVAIAGDTMVVGAEAYGEGGGAFVYVNEGGFWVRRAKLTASDGDPEDQFGSAVAISGDTIVVGAPGDDDAGNSSGSAYVFVRSGTSWLEAKKLIAADARARDYFGSSVDIDRGRIVAATNFSAYVFSQTGTDWSQTAQLTPSAPNTSLHSSGAVTIAGDTIAIGAPDYDGVANDAGAVFIYTKAGALDWSQQARIELSDPAENDRFGTSVSLHADTLAIGGSNVDGTGAAYAFVRDGSSWTQQAKLQPDDLNEIDLFGLSVSASGDGIVVGAPRQDGAAAVLDSGAAYLFQRDGTTWSLHEKLTLPNPASQDDFGDAVAIDGANVAISSPFRTAPAAESAVGEVHLFGIDSTSFYDESAASTFIDPNLLVNEGGSARPYLPMLISPETVARTDGSDVYFGFELTPIPGTRTPAPLVEIDRADRDDDDEAVESAAEVPAEEGGEDSFLIAALNDGLYHAKSPNEKFDLRVYLVGDINRDDVVDVEDGRLIRALLGSTRGEEQYDPDTDVDRNGRIDATDYSLWRRNLGVSVLPIREENSTVTVDSSIADFKEIEVDPIGQGLRTIAAITDGSGGPSYFVQNELIIETDDEAELKEFLERVNGTVVAEIDPAQYKLEELRPTYLVQVDPGKFDDSGLERDLFELNPEVRTDYQVSSNDARRLLAAAAKEVRNDFEVGINWIGRDAMFRDGATVDGPSPFGPDAFAWPHMSSGSTQDIGVAEAWRVMELAGVIDTGVRIPIAIVDRGFTRTRDFANRFDSSFAVLAGSAPLGTPGWNWHGTHVAEAAMGVADNGAAGAGPAGSFGHAVIGHFGGDFFSSSQAVMESYGAGARIINMSFGTDVLLPWSIRSFNRTTRAISGRGALLFAAAGNSGEDVDRTGRFGLVESRWHAPCENDGVICVGGLAENSKDRHPDSSYGHEDVDIFAPYVVATTADPASPTATAEKISGTSFSSPFAAGVAAMIWKANPSLTTNEVANILFSTAHSSPDRSVGSYVNALDAVMEALGGDAPPYIQISSPTDGSSFSKGADIVLEADAEDYEDGNALPVVWASDRQGRIGVDVALEDLAPGEHVITATIVDSAGQSTSDRITIQIAGLNPIVNILKPDLPVNVINFTGFHQNFNRWYADISLAGEAKDSEGNELKGTQLVWTTNRTDLHGPQPLDIGGSVDVRLWGEENCSIVTHVITLTATDGEGNVSSESIEIQLTNLC